MNRDNLIRVIATALDSCISAKGDKISNYFNTDEVRDFANTVVAYLPSTLDKKFLELNEDIYECFADKDIIILEHLKLITKKLYTSFMFDEGTTLYTKHMIYTSLMFLFLIHNESPEEVLEEITNYYKTLSLTANELKENVDNVKATATTISKPNSEFCVRMEFMGHFVPTVKTITNYKHLIPFENYELRS